MRPSVKQRSWILLVLVSCLLLLLRPSRAALVVDYAAPNHDDDDAANDDAEEERRQRLHFRQDDNGFSKFKILQITDIHLGEYYANANDPRTFGALRSILSQEQPDLIVLSGDMVTSDVIQYTADDYLELLFQDVLTPLNIPWAMIFGNHDVAHYRSYDYTRYDKAHVRRATMAKRDARHALSLTQLGPRDLFGQSNYWLDIYNSDSDSDAFVATRVLLLDTGGGMLPKRLDASQVNWFRNTNDPDVATVCFQHMPTIDMQYSSNKCQGETLTAYTDAISSDAGMMQALQEAANVKFVAVGHNHGNSYCCPFENDDNDGGTRSSYSSNANSISNNMHYCFGRRSGYGGAVAFKDHGARVYELGYEHATGEVHWRSFVRTEHGEIVDEYYPE